MKFDCIVVGAGLTGLSSARYLADKGYKVLIFEQSNVIGGLCREEYFKNTRYSLYGPHIFHTNSRTVWDFLSRFTEWIEYTHIVKSFCGGKLWSVPIDYTEVLDNEWGKHILYSNLYLDYSKKMWGPYYNDVYKSTLSRLSQTGSQKTDIRYFTDKYQGLPSEGYNAMMQKMIDIQTISITLHSDFDIDYVDRDTPVIYTGRIDKLLGNTELPFQTVKFRYDFYSKFQWSDKYSVINFPQDYDFIRAHSSKMLYQQDTKHDITCFEYPGETGPECYPLLYPESQAIYTETFFKVTEKYPHVIPAGRAGSFKYVDMDDAVLEGIQAAEKVMKVKQLIKRSLL
jgi:UDP-galactopyranose mutase